MAKGIPGQRLLPHVYDDIAKHEPDRKYAELPYPDWQKDGWYDVTYSQIATTVNRMARWLDRNLKARETFVYAGPDDLRYPIAVLAAMKTRRTIVLPDPGMATVAQLYIVEKTGSTTLIGATDFCVQEFHKIQQQKPELRVVDGVPPMDDLLSPKVDSSPYPYEVSYQEVKDDLAIVIHTSGTTGMPKIVSYTHEAWNVFDAKAAVAIGTPPEQGVVNWNKAADRRLLNTFRMAWIGGLSGALQYIPFIKCTFTMLPEDSPKPLTVDYMTSIYKRLGHIEGGIHTPFIIRDMCKNPESLKVLTSSVKLIIYAGAPLDDWVGDLLQEKGVEVICSSGSVEMDGLVAYCPPAKEWLYTRPHPMMGMVMEPVSKPDDEVQYFEAVIHKQPHLKPFQSVFIKMPHLGDTYRTNDLYTRHPDPRYFDLYKPAGRADDLVKTDNMAKFFVRPIEIAAEKVMGVRAAIVSGEKRPCPFIVIESDPSEGANAASLADRVWFAVEPEIRQYRDELRPKRGLVLICDGSKTPFVRTGKGSISRVASLKQYEKEIDAMFAKVYGAAANGHTVSGKS